MKYAPNKIFILENGRYQELTYEEFCKRKEQEPEFSEKLFVPIHGVLMEVTEKTYREFYRDKRRQKYIKEQEVDAEIFPSIRSTRTNFSVKIFW